MGLNRYRRGYAIEEAASGVHFQDVGSYRARPVSNFNIKIPSSLSPYHKYQQILLKIYRSYSTKQSIRFYHTSYQGKHQGRVISNLPHASRYQTTPINLNT